MKTRTARSTETAADAYARLQQEARGKLAEIAKLLEAHAAKQAEQPRNWGYAGDLGGLVEELEQLRAGLAGEDR